MATLSAQEFLKGQPLKKVEAIEEEIKKPGFAAGVGLDLQKRREELARGIKSDQGLPSTILQTAGAGAGLGLDIAARGIGAVLPDVVEEAIGKGLGIGIRTIGKIGGVTPEETARIYSAWKEKNPEAARNLESVVNIASFIPVGLGAIRATKAIPVIAGKGIELTKAGGQKALALAKPATEYAKGRVPKGLSIFTGEGDDVVRTALQNPEVARRGIEGGDVALREALNKAAIQSNKIRTNIVMGQKQAFRKLAGEFGNKNVASTKELLSPLKDILKSKGVRIGKNELDFRLSKIVANPGEISKIQAAWNAVGAWEDFSLAGVQDFKQLVGQLTKFATEAGIPSKSPTLGNYYHSIDSLIKIKLPKDLAQRYGEMNAQFSKVIDLADEMVDAFNSGDPFTKLANSLGKNKDTLRHVIDFYQKQSGQQILPLVAGRELAMEKTAAFGFLNPRSWIDLFLSPEFQAKTVVKIGEKFYKP